MSHPEKVRDGSSGDAAPQEQQREAMLLQELDVRHARIQELERELAELKRSSSWKLTAPLRGVKRLLMTLLQLPRKAVTLGRLIWPHIAIAVRNPGELRRKASWLLRAFASGGMRGLRERLVLSREMQQAQAALPPLDELGVQMQALISVQEKVATRPGKQVVDVVVPVYLGLSETKRCLESVLAFPSATPLHLIVVNDASPDPDVTQYLRDLAKVTDLTLLENEHNLGFVGAVNRGMKLHSDRDVVLLNSDTQVANDWLDRLHTHAHAAVDVASVTPFSNNATICSFPDLLGWPDLPDGVTTAQLDSYFHTANSGASIDIPTAVGFCMYIKRAALTDAGYFDEEAFGRGYGEENDFCMKAAALGWRHVLAADTFVFHQGEVSFRASAVEQKAKATEIIESRYPDYSALISAHIAANEAHVYRARAAACWMRDSELPTVLFVSHAHGGGTDHHIQQLEELAGAGMRCLLLKPGVGGAKRLQLSSRGADRLLLDLSSENMELLVATLKQFGINRVHVHHNMGFEFELEQMTRMLDLPYDLTLHDYRLICPRVTLTSVQGTYCGEPTAAECNRCITSEPTVIDAGDIQWWRMRGASLLMGAQRVFCPSQDVATRIRKYVPRANLLVVEHETVEPARSPAYRIVPSARLKVALLGALGDHKGLFVLENLLAEITAERLPIEVTLIGYTDRPLADHPALSVTGPYAADDLPNLIRRHKPDLVLFASVCPETFCYTLSVAMALGCSIVAPRLGAFEQRLENYPNAHFLENTWNPELGARLLNLPRIVPAAEPASPGTILPNTFYEQEYLQFDDADRLGDDLVIVPEMLGTIPSPCSYLRLLGPLFGTPFTDVLNVRVGTFDGLINNPPAVAVVNRIPTDDFSKLEAVLSSLKRNGVKLVYDLDDMLMELPDSHPEKQFYEAKEIIVRKLIRAADVVWVSTPPLKAEVDKLSKGAKVVLNSPAIPLRPKLRHESGSAARGATARTKRVARILYMGSYTHAADLELVVEPLSELAKKYDRDIELHIAGVLPTALSQPWMKRLVVPDGHVSYPLFMHWLSTLEPFEFGIAPLREDPFNNCKSAIKALDYCSLGFVTLASATEVYRSQIEHGVNGFLTENSKDEWVAALQQLLELDSESKRNVLTAAQQQMDSIAASSADIRLQSLADLDLIPSPVLKNAVS